MYMYGKHFKWLVVRRGSHVKFGPQISALGRHGVGCKPLEAQGFTLGAVTNFNDCIPASF